MSIEPEGNATGGSGAGPIPDQYLPGDQINWDSKRVPVELTIELPFWLLVPNGAVNLAIGDCTVRARVVNDGIQFALGHHQTVSQQRTVFLGSLEDAAKASTPLGLLTGGGQSRLTRTLVTFEALAHSDSLEALKSKDVKHQQGCKYFQSLAIAHLDFLNLLINSYRRLTFDPFATEVSAWDVPVWTLSAEEIKFNIILFPYLATESRPAVTNLAKPSEVRPYTAASLEDIQKISSIDATPGEVELLDGWSLYYRGRYADSIRSFVTAIEVVLEARLKEVMRGAESIARRCCEEASQNTK